LRIYAENIKKISSDIESDKKQKLKALFDKDVWNSKKYWLRTFRSILINNW